MSGDVDLQVPAAVNLAAISKALAKGGNEDVTTEVLSGLDHLFQTAKTGKVEEVAQLEETLAPLMLDKVTAWVRARGGL